MEIKSRINRQQHKNRKAQDRLKKLLQKDTYIQHVYGINNLAISWLEVREHESVNGWKWKAKKKKDELHMASSLLMEK